MNMIFLDFGGVQARSRDLAFRHVGIPVNTQICSRRGQLCVHPICVIARYSVAISDGLDTDLQLNRYIVC